jgi:hypothetical protein
MRILRVVMTAIVQKYRMPPRPVAIGGSMAQRGPGHPGLELAEPGSRVAEESGRQRVVDSSLSLRERVGVRAASAISGPQQPHTAAMASKLQSEEGKAANRKRKWIDEPPNGWIKNVLTLTPTLSQRERE